MLTDLGVTDIAEDMTSVYVVTSSYRIKKNYRRYPWRTLFDTDTFSTGYSIGYITKRWCFLVNHSNHLNIFFYFYAKVMVEKLVLKLNNNHGLITLKLRVSSRIGLCPCVGHTWLSPTLMRVGGKPLQRKAGSESDTACRLGVFRWQYFLYESSISAGKGIDLIQGFSMSDI